MVKNMELPSNDGVHKLHVVVWQPNGEPKAVLQRDPHAAKGRLPHLV